MKIQKYKKLFQVTLVAVIVYMVLKYLLPLVLPFVLAYFICRMLYPTASWLSARLHCPLGLCAALLVGAVTVIFIVLVGAGAWYLFTQLQALTRQLGDLESYFSQLLDQVCLWLSGFTGNSSEVIKETLCGWGDRLLIFLHERLPMITANLALPFIKGLGALFVVLIVAVVGAILLMKNKKRIKYQLSKNIFAREISGLTGRVCEVSAGFFKCQMIIIAVIAVVLSVGLRLAGNPYGILIGVVVAFLDALPVLGSGTVLLPWALFSLIGGNYIQSLVLTGLYVACTVIREMLEPRLMGDKLGINEFYMLMATFIGIALFGVWGIFLGPLGMVMILEILGQMEDLYAGEQQQNDG